MQDKKRKRILQVIGITIVVVSSIMLYFQWQAYKKLKAESNPFAPPDIDLPNLGLTNDPIQEDPDAWKGLMVDPLPAPSMSWKKFKVNREKSPDVYDATMLPLVDIGDPDLDTKMFIKLFSSGKLAHRLDVLDRIYSYDTSIPNITQGKRDAAYDLYSTLLNEHATKQEWEEMQARTAGALQYKTCNLDRFIKYCQYFEKKDSEVTRILRFDGYHYPKYLAFHLKKMEVADRAPLKDDLVKLFGLDLLKKDCPILFEE